MTLHCCPRFRLNYSVSELLPAFSDQFESEDSFLDEDVKEEGDVGTFLSRSTDTIGWNSDEGGLYDGADITVFQSYFLLFQYAVGHSLTSKAFSELLQLLTVRRSTS